MFKSSNVKQKSSVSPLNLDEKFYLNLPDSTPQTQRKKEPTIDAPPLSQDGTK
jgi:hypothetical protein